MTTVAEPTPETRLQTVYMSNKILVDNSVKYSCVTVAILHRFKCFFILLVVNYSVL
jgi:hypothetical protein